MAPPRSVTGRASAAMCRSCAATSPERRALSSTARSRSAVSSALAGLLFAAVAGRQLTRAAALLTGRVGGTLLGALLVWVGIPILAVLAFITLVGIPLGFALLLFL